LLLELRAIHDAHHDRLETIIVLSSLPHDRPDRWHVRILNGSAERVSHQLLRDRLHELGRMREQYLAHVIGALDVEPTPLAGGVDRRRRLTILVAPAADRVEILE